MQNKKTIQELASMGGKAVYKKLGAKHMSSIGKKGAAKRWGKQIITNKYDIKQGI